MQHHQAAITQPDFFLFYQEEKDYYDKGTSFSVQLIISPPSLIYLLLLLSSVFIFIRPFGLRRGSRHNLVVSSSICQEMYYNHISLSIRHHRGSQRLSSAFTHPSGVYIRSFLFIFLSLLYRRRRKPFLLSAVIVGVVDVGFWWCRPPISHIYSVPTHSGERETLSGL